MFENPDIAFSPSLIAHSNIRYNWNKLTAEWSAKYVSRQYLDNTQTRSRSLDPYLVNNLRLNYDWHRAPIFDGIQASLMVNNILNEQYESNGSTFGYITGKEQQHTNYYYPQASRNFLLQLSFTF